MAVPVSMVVPGHEVGRERSRVGEGREPVREHRCVLQRLEPGLAVRVVVGHRRPRVRVGHRQVFEQVGDGFRGHRRAPVGVDHVRDAVGVEDLADHRLRDGPGLAGVYPLPRLPASICRDWVDLVRWGFGGTEGDRTSRNGAGVGGMRRDAAGPLTCSNDMS